MITNAAQYVVRILETYTTEALALRSVPAEALRDELHGVRERIDELIAEIDRSESPNNQERHDGKRLRSLHSAR